jgi:hypothetical protein
MGSNAVGIEREFSPRGMPLTTPCVQCGVVGNVRWERVLTGTVIFVEYFCGRCEHVWRVDGDERLTTATTPKEKPERSRTTVLPEYADRRFTLGERPGRERWR